MQTIEEYKEYTQQLEGEVKKWHDAFDASEQMNRNLVADKDAEIAQLQAMLEERNKQVTELKEERRWRNLKDEQPQEGERVLIVDEYFQDISMAMYTDDHCWELNSGATILTTAFPYWMPLPSAPKEGK